MSKPPLSVSVIAWFIMVSGVVLAVPLILIIYALSFLPEAADNSRIEPGLRLILVIFNLGITFTCGAGLLKGKNWARLLYIGWNIFGFFADLFLRPRPASGTFFGVLLFLTIVFFLYRPKANELFLGGGPVFNDPLPEVEGRNP